MCCQRLYWGQYCCCNNKTAEVLKTEVVLSYNQMYRCSDHASAVALTIGLHVSLQDNQAKAPAEQFNCSESGGGRQGTITGCAV